MRHSNICEPGIKILFAFIIMMVAMPADSHIQKPISAAIVQVSADSFTPFLPLLAIRRPDSSSASPAKSKKTSILMGCGSGAISATWQNAPSRVICVHPVAPALWGLAITVHN